MAGTMDSYVSKGDEIKDQLNQGVEEAGDKARDFEGVKQGLSGMPGGLDPDLLQMISDAEEMNALAYAVPVSEYKDWIVRVSIEKREFLVER